MHISTPAFLSAPNSSKSYIDNRQRFEDKNFESPNLHLQLGVQFAHQLSSSQRNRAGKRTVRRATEAVGSLRSLTRISLCEWNVWTRCLQVAKAHRCPQRSTLRWVVEFAENEEGARKGMASSPTASVYMRVQRTGYSLSASRARSS